MKQKIFQGENKNGPYLNGAENLMRKTDNKQRKQGSTNIINL